MTIPVPVLLEAFARGALVGGVVLLAGLGVRWLWTAARIIPPAHREPHPWPILLRPAKPVASVASEGRCSLCGGACRLRRPKADPRPQPSPLRPSPGLSLRLDIDDGPLVPRRPGPTNEELLAERNRLRAELGKARDASGRNYQAWRAAEAENDRLRGDVPDPRPRDAQGRFVKGGA